MQSLRIAGILLVICPVTVEAQRIPDAPACRNCSITTELAATLAHESLVDVREVVTDSAHRYWVINNNQLPTLFDSSGRFLAVVGRRGQGPKELLRPNTAWPLPGDSVALLELGGKAVVFGPDLSYARTLSVPADFIPASLVLTWPTNVLVSSAIRTEASAGYPLHVVDVSSAQGRISKSFGSNGSVTAARGISGYFYAMAPSADGGFWSTPQAEHRITKWSRDHRPLFVLERRPEWFPGRSSLSPGNAETAPAPRLAGIVEDEDGLLWTFSLVPAPDWRKAWARLGGATPGEVPVSMVDWEYLYHTRVEVLDPRDRTVLAAHRLDRGVTSVLTGPRGVFILEDELGVPSIRVIRFRLVRR